MATAIGKVAAVFTASTSGLTTGVNQAGRSMRKLQNDVSGLRSSLNLLTAIQGAQLFGSMASAAASAGQVLIGFGRQAAAGLNDAVQSAVDLGEEASKSSVIFGDAAGEIARFAESSSAIGLSEVAALRATGQFGNLFTAMGLARDESASMATQLTGLAADLASFNNATVDESIQALGAALRGESEPIRRFGVLLDDATLRQVAFEKGLTASTKNALTPAIKAQAAYAAILRQTTTAQGDFARTSGSLANLGRIVTAQTSNIVGNVGSAFVPVFQSAVSAVSRVLGSLEPFFAQFAEGLQGYIDRLASALDGLGPLFQSFVGGLDGRAAGEAVGQAIISASQFFADIADYVISGLSGVFANAASVGESWAVGWELGGRVANALYGAFKTFETIGNVIGGLFSDIFAGALGIAAEIADWIPGFDETADKLAASAQGWNAQARQFAASMNENTDAAAAAFGRAFGESTAASAPEAAGPIRKALDESLARFRQQLPAAIGAAAGPGAGPAAGPQVVAPQTPTSEALRAVDSTSREGIAEMFRIMRGDTGNLQERQTEAAERTAAAVERIADQGGESAFDTELVFWGA